MVQFNQSCKTAEELQACFEQLCEMDENELKKLWENSEVCAKLKLLNERFSDAHWELFRDTIKCSKCGFGFFPNGAWFQDGQCIEHNNFDFRPNYYPNCGKRVHKE